MGTVNPNEFSSSEDAEELAFEAYQEERMYQKYVNLYGDWIST